MMGGLIAEISVCFRTKRTERMTSTDASIQASVWMMPHLGSARWRSPQDTSASCVCFSANVTQQWDRSIGTGTPLPAGSGASQQQVELQDRTWLHSTAPTASQLQRALRGTSARPLSPALHTPASLLVFSHIESKINLMWTSTEAEEQAKTKSPPSKDRESPAAPWSWPKYCREGVGASQNCCLRRFFNVYLLCFTDKCLKIHIHSFTPPLWPF